MRSVFPQRVPLSYIVLFSLVACIGCQEGPTLVDASGTVTLDSKPLPGASITFTPTGTEGTTASGITDAEGHYYLKFSRDKDGVMPGSYNVIIETEKLSPEDIAAAKEAGEEVHEFVPVPLRYQRNGELTTEITAEGSDELNFDLTTN